MTIVRDKAVRRAAHLRLDARRRDVRRSATRPPRTGSSSSTCCVTSAARELSLVRGRRARQPRLRPRRSGRSRRTTRPTSSSSSTSSTSSTARTARSSSRTPLELHRRHQPLHHRGRAQPAADAGRVRRHRPAAGTRPLEGHRPDRDRVAGRRDLRQAAAAASSRWRSCSRASQKRFGATRGTAAVAATSARSDDPEAPIDRAQRQALPLPRRRPSTRGGQRRAARPGLGHAEQVVATRERRAVATRRRRRDPRRPAGPSRLPGRCRTRCVVSGRDSKSGHPLAVFGPQTGYFAPQILMEQDVHGPGIDARGAAFPGVEPLRPARPRRATTPGARPRPGQDIADTFARAPVRPERRQADASTRTTTCSAASACRSRCSTRTNSLDAQRRRPDAGRAPRRSRASARKLGLVTARATIERQAGGLHRAALDLLPRGRLRARLHGLQQPGQDPAARTTSSTPPPRSATPSTGSTSTTSTSPTSTPATTRSASRAVDPNFPVAGAAVRVAELQPGHQHGGDYTPFAQHPQVHRPGLPHELEQQAGAGLRARRTRTELQRRSTARSRSTTASGPAIKAQEQDRRSPSLVNAMEDAGTVDLRGDKVLPLVCSRCSASRATRTLAERGRRAARPGSRRAPHRRDRDRDGVYDDADGDPDHGRLVAAAG